MKKKISTLQTIYREGKEQLELSGVPDADLDAWYLLEFVTGISKARYYGNPEAGMEEEEVLRYRDVIRQRAERIPLQHITGEQEFMGFSFQVNEHVLIPRQDTETLVEEALGVLKPKMEILDLCTGSGCILLSLLKLGEKQGIAGLKGTGADISREALKVAEENGRRLEIPGDQLAWVRGDLFEKLEGPFDLLVSNPPYIPSGELSGLQEEVRLHDPALALDGHEDGLYFYRRIAAEAGKYLRDGAFLMLEIGWDQGKAVRGLLEAAGYQEVEVKKDLSGNDRVVRGRYGK
ncbi:peptide chain release factor N(5)-glutamine methyltransferase [Massilistercora timonensis]|uniref:peptide chain release factor N(5)-glutamine methyltransferase n=1 Tax=Massilistercora timonensis TaxID=2086584 RepID=UPI00320A5AF4